MRTKKAILNSSINIISFIISFIPNLFVRKVFLQTLGSSMLGLSSLYTNIIGWLSIVEMGIGTAIIYSLYKPYANGEKDKIRAYIKFYGDFYKKIGLLILILGIIISPFLQFFIKDEIDTSIVLIGFLLYLINSFISYLFSHKLCILNVAQEAYKITIGTTISKLVIALLQIMMLNIYPNFIVYIVVQIMVNLIYFILINKYIDKRYKWIDSGNETLPVEEKDGLLKNVKALFMHKIGGLVVNSTDNLVISKFVGLSILGNYTNYQMIISSLQSLLNSALNGMTASIGNMLTEKDSNYSYEVHKKIFFLNFWIVSLMVITLYNVLNQFIVLWVGIDKILDNITFTVILINVYFAGMRGSVEQFQSGSGNFHQDRYAPIFEAIINLSLSLILVKYIGLTGVFIGTLISNFSVIFWTKPYIVYKYVFNRNLREYFKMYFKYFTIGIMSLLFTVLLTKNIKEVYTFEAFVLNCLINLISVNTIYIIIFKNTDIFNYYKKLIFKLLKSKRSKIVVNN